MVVTNLPDSGHPQPPHTPPPSCLLSSLISMQSYDANAILMLRRMAISSERDEAG